MKPQTMYRGNDNKKVKATKAEKVFNMLQKAKRRALPVIAKKETAA